jgi:hypothetical protein
MYYNDPLHAAIMARDFGVDYYDPGTGKQWLWDEDGQYYYIKTTPEKRNCMMLKSDKLHIHPDSYDIFQPKDEDLIHIVKGFVSYHKIVDSVVKNKNIVTGIWSEGTHFDISEKKPLHDWEIIQRDNKAFYNPIKEMR